MDGKVINTKVNRFGKRFGNIKGENGLEYYFVFDAQYFLKPEDAESLKVDDEVSFEPFIKYEDRGPWARKILITKAAEDMIPVSEGAGFGRNYYEPGYSKPSLRNSIFRNYLKPYSGEIDVLDRFSEVFRISYGNSHDLGNGTIFPFCIFGATELVKRYMGSYEFLVVFSHFDSERWQENTLLAINAIRKRREVSSRRPMVNFYILISNAVDFKQEIDRIKGGTDSAIIPFSFSEIINSPDKASLSDLVISRFDEYYFENDMLGEKDAIEEDALLFGDRGKIADSIARRCVEKKHSGIFGLRRSGKSSVLKAVLRRLEAQGVKYVKIESRSELEHTESWKIALFDIARRIRIESLGVKQNDDETRREFDARLKLNSTTDEYLRRPTQCFVEDVQLYTRGNPIFVIAIDEIELITYNTATPKTWRDLDAYEGFWGALRDCGCSLIVCGVNSMINEKSRIDFNGKTCDNPMYERIHLCSGFDKTYLPAFTDEQTKVMINTLGGYSNIAFENVYVDINRAFGGQPYAIRQFCSYVFQNVKDLRSPNTVYQVKKPTFDALIAQFSTSSRGIELFGTILQHVEIYAAEYEMLKRIALSPEKYRKVSDSDLQTIDHLEKYGLIQRDSDTGYISFCSDALQQYMQNNLTKPPEDMNNEERRRYVQDRIANCERKLKKYIIYYYKFNETEAAGKTALQRFVSPNPNAKPTPIYAQCSLEEIFDHSLFIIFFSDLRKIIYQNWNTLGNKISHSISRERFNLYMIDMNAGRNDADHYDPEDMTCPDEWEIGDAVLTKFKTANEALTEFFKKMSL